MLMPTANPSADLMSSASINLFPCQIFAACVNPYASPSPEIRERTIISTIVAAEDIAIIENSIAYCLGVQSVQEGITYVRGE